MKRTILLLAGLMLAGTLQAQWGKKIKGNGNTVTIEREVGSYDGLYLSGWYKVELVAGKEGEITLRGEENLLEYVLTEVDGGTLEIRTKKNYNLKPSSREGITIVVPVEEIDELALSGSGDIIGKTLLNADDFKMKVSGSGDMDAEVEAKSIEAILSGSGDLVLSGRASSLDVKVSGSGDVDASQLESNVVEIVISGSADVSVHAKDYLKARVSGSADVSYKGNPKKLDTKISGSGEVTKM